MLSNMEIGGANVKAFILASAILCFSLSTYAEEVKMQEQNKQVVRKLYEQCINTGKMEMLTDLVAEDYVSDGQNGVTGFATNIESLRKGFPNIQFTVEDLIAEGDRVTARWQWQGTHDGTFRGIPATHKQVTNDGIVIYQLRDGKIIHSWLQTDRLGALQQIGVIPKDLGVPVNKQH
jgi:steroid delta-isomerase-like uncharacterized protein